MSKKGLALVLVLAIGLTGKSKAMAQEVDCANYRYTIQEGDYLIKIARELGDSSKWTLLYSINNETFPDPDLIYPGQKLIIPPSFFNQVCTTLDANLIEVDTIAEVLDYRSESEKDPTANDEEQLAKLRELMAQLSEKKETNTDPGLEIDGLIIDETRSKMGKDFFDVFYQQWIAPENALNFTITIQERPMPGLGTIVSVKVNDQNTFQTRLQPKYELIQQYGWQAVVATHQHLKLQPTFKIY
ncbi:CsgE family curli-type amyloid fiber assembly protein [Gracilimonas aurantiaca]|uniref:CsgE family curli-type amyloid fiber assembly protein n=1 Tax=Gracilimonas aurantiaca TaxID=3234185 RepID=UPI003465A60A